jgi:nucleotide-binding universal stress UspA family protein
MIRRVLVAVDDSAGGLAALRIGVELARELGATLRAVTVVGGGQLQAGPDRDDTQLDTRRQAAADAVLRHAAEVARASGVPAEMSKAQGTVADHVLAEARAWPADLVVLGRSREAGVGGPFIGGQTRLVLEFADVPVLVVPPPSR